MPRQLVGRHDGADDDDGDDGDNGDDEELPSPLHRCPTGRDFYQIVLRLAGWRGLRAGGLWEEPKRK